MIVVYLPDGFADWEGGFLLGELAEARVACTVVADGSSVRSMGGLRVIPDAQLVQVPASSVSCFVTIGSDAWQNPSYGSLAFSVASAVLARGGTVASICASTMAMARAGVVGDRRFTSNSLSFLRHVAPSVDVSRYVDAPVVVDRGLITAPGHRPVQFTHAVLRALGVYSDAKLDAWLALYDGGVVPPDSYWAMK